MTTILSIFNNKGGVGKTSYMFQVSHLLARRGRKVLMVDCDNQCNLTGYSLTDEDIRKAWDIIGNNIYRVIEPVYEGIGDFNKHLPHAAMMNVVHKLIPLNQAEQRRNYNLGQIPTLHSLIPYSLNARKPVFDCSHREGLTGEHISSARESVEYFFEIVKIIDSALKNKQLTLIKIAS